MIIKNINITMTVAIYNGLKNVISDKNNMYNYNKYNNNN